MYKVLLVDDEPSVVERLMMVDWSRYGFTVCGSASNGEDALEAAKLSSPDLIVTDIKMPVVDGLEFIRIAVEGLNLKAKFIILSGYDEFSFAQEAMRLNVGGYILKPLVDEELDEMVSRMALQIRQDRMDEEYVQRRMAFVAGHIVRRLIKGDRKSSLYSRAEMLLDLGQSDEIRCLLYDIGLKGLETNSPYDQQAMTQKAAARGIFEAALGREHGMAFFEDEEDRFLIIASPKKPFYNSLGTFAQNMSTELGKRLSNPITVSMRLPAPGIEMLAEVYRQCVYALNFRFLLEEGRIIRYEDVQGEIFNYGLCIENPTSLLELVKENRREELDSSIKQLFREFLANMKAPGPVRAFIRNFELEAIKLVDELDGDTELLTQKAVVLNTTLESLTIKKLQECFTDFCMEAALMISALKQRESRDIIAEVKDYIMRNYSKDIKLKEVARIFYINPVYLGQLFKKAAGMQFNEYLHNVRIDKAKKLLKRTGMKVSEIAVAVGYNDPKYFLCKFRSITNRPPSDFKLKNTDHLG